MSDPNLEQLKAVFPDLEVDILGQMLSFHRGSVEAVVGALLDAVDEEERQRVEADAATARKTQCEMDAEVARELQKEMNAQGGVGQIEAMAAPIMMKAAGKLNAATAATKNLAAKHLPTITPAALQRALAKSRLKTGSTRLLDDQAVAWEDQPSGEFIASSLDPAAVERYVPPSPNMPNSSPADSAKPMAADEPPPYATNYSANYAARVDRARVANRASASSRHSGSEATGSAPQDLMGDEMPTDLLGSEPPAADPWADLAALPPLKPMASQLPDVGKLNLNDISPQMMSGGGGSAPLPPIQRGFSLV